jgi:glycine cleavage system H lipoate-binding protein
MATSEKESRRDRIGYGSTYRKGSAGEPARGAVKSVLGGQTWMVEPDCKAKAAHPCVWMQAGAVKFKNCTHFYDCPTCIYDHAMGEKAKAGKQVSWQAAMRLRPEMHRLCRHSLTGRIAQRACAYNYECAACDFDQYFEDVWSARSVERTPAEIQRIRGFDLPHGHGFHDGHTWARIESGGAIRIGMDDFAQKLFGPADGYELPLMGKELNPGRPSWELRRRGCSAKVLAPLGGVIVDVNPLVREAPETVNREPYGGGWLFLVRTPDAKQALKPLMADHASAEWMRGEVEQLEHMIEAVAGPLAADGGFLADDIYGHLPGLEWGQLTHRFLKT